MMRTKCSGQAGHNPAKPAGSAKKIVLVDMPAAPRVRVVETDTTIYANMSSARQQAIERITAMSADEVDRLISYLQDIATGVVPMPREVVELSAQLVED